MTNHGHTSKAALVLLTLPLQTESRRPFITTLPRHNLELLAAGLEARGGGLFGNNKSDGEEWEYYQEDEADQELITGAEDDAFIDEYEYYEDDSSAEFQDLNGDLVDSTGTDVQWEEAENDEMNPEQADDEEFLMSTPIPIKEKNISRGWFSLKKGSKSTNDSSFMEEFANENDYDVTTDSDLDGVDDEQSGCTLAEDQEVETTPFINWFGRSNSSPVTKSKAESLELDEAPIVKTKTNSKPKQPKEWTQSKPKTTKPKKVRRKTTKAILPRSSSGASFIYPINKLTSMVRSFPSASVSGRSGGRNIIAATIDSVSRMAAAIIQPMLLVITTALNVIAKWASIILALLRQAVDALWYGPVDGVTTTGISRAGGLGCVFIISSPLVVIASSALVVGLVILVRQQTANANGGRAGNAFSNVFKRFRQGAETTHNEEDDGFYDTDDSEPSPEEELQFLNSFDAANPTSRERISKKISKRNMWPFNASQKPTPRQETRQHQRSIKSIQKWWRQRPSNTIQIIEPSHVQQPPPSQQIARLRNQLAQSEQDRAVLQSDVARLQHRLQKAHHDAKAIMSKNQWLEKQQS